MAAKQADDGSASLFFLLAMLLVIVAPWTLCVVWGLFTHGKAEISEAFPTFAEDGNRVRECATAAMITKRAKQVRRLRSLWRRFTRGFVFRLVVLLCLWCWLVYIAVQVRSAMANSQLYENFNPYDILQVSSSAGKQEVKQAYRKLSLKHHPDRNQGDRAAAERFMLVKKAYDSLTDPVARRNYQLYGNPDGPTTMEMGMAIPTVSKENQGIVLVLFVFVFVLGVPLAMLMLISGEGAVARNGVLNSTMEALAANVSPQLDFAGALDLLLSSGETTACARRSEDEAFVAAVLKELPALPSVAAKASKQKAVADPIAAERVAARRTPEALLLAHLHRRLDLLSEKMQADLDALLPRWRTIALAMAEVAAQQKFSLALAAAVDVHRHLVQAIEPGSAASRELAQLPHLKPQQAKRLKVGKKKDATLSSFLEQTSAERASSLETLDLGQQELADIAEFAVVAPRLTVKHCEVYVEGESTICFGDVATLVVTFERSNLRPEEAAGAAHAPLFPDGACIGEAWWLVLASPNGRKNIGICKRLTERGHEVQAKVRFRVPQIKKVRLAVELICEAYVGLDVKTSHTFAAERQAGGAASSGSDVEDIDVDVISE